MAKGLAAAVEINKAAPCDAAFAHQLGARLRWKEWLQTQPAPEFPLGETSLCSIDRAVFYFLQGFFYDWKITFARVLPLQRRASYISA
jgi:hypothetical protein